MAMAAENINGMVGSGIVAALVINDDINCGLAGENDVTSAWYGVLTVMCYIAFNELLIIN